MEKIIRVIERKRICEVDFAIVETKYEFATHYVLYTGGLPGFHSTDLERVQNYMRSFEKYSK